MPVERYIHISDFTDLKPLGSDSTSYNGVYRGYYQGELFYIKKCSAKYNKNLAKLELAAGTIFSFLPVVTPPIWPLYDENEEFCGSVTKGLPDFEDMNALRNRSLTAELLIRYNFIALSFLRFVMADDDDYPKNNGTVPARVIEEDVTTQENLQVMKEDSSQYIDASIMSNESVAKDPGSPSELSDSFMPLSDYFAVGIDFDMCFSGDFGSDEDFKSRRSTDGFTNRRDVKTAFRFTIGDLNTFPVLTDAKPNYHSSIEAPSLRHPLNGPQNCNYSKIYYNAAEFKRMNEDPDLRPLKQHHVALAAIHFLLLSAEKVETALRTVLEDEAFITRVMTWLANRKQELKNAIFQCSWFISCLEDKTTIPLLLKTKKIKLSYPDEDSFIRAYYQLFQESWQQLNVIEPQLTERLADLTNFSERYDPSRVWGKFFNRLRCPMLRQMKHEIELLFKSTFRSEKIVYEWQDYLVFLAELRRILKEAYKEFVSKNFPDTHPTSSIDPVPEALTNITAIFSSLWNFAIDFCVKDPRLDQKDFQDQKLSLATEERELTESFIETPGGFTLLVPWASILDNPGSIATALQPFLDNNENQEKIKAAVAKARENYCPSGIRYYTGTSRDDEIDGFVKAFDTEQIIPNVTEKILNFTEKGGWHIGGGLSTTSYNTLLFAELCLQLFNMDDRKNQREYQNFITLAEKIRQSLKDLPVSNPSQLAGELLDFLSKPSSHRAILLAATDAYESYNKEVGFWRVAGYSRTEDIIQLLKDLQLYDPEHPDESKKHEAPPNPLQCVLTCMHKGGWQIGGRLASTSYNIFLLVHLLLRALGFEKKTHQKEYEQLLTIVLAVKEHFLQFAQVSWSVSDTAVTRTASNQNVAGITVGVGPALAESRDTAEPAPSSDDTTIPPPSSNGRMSKSWFGW